MIRVSTPNDISQIMEIWLSSNVDAHGFVPEKYWKDNYSLVREAITSADVYVYEEGNQIQGFIGAQGTYIAGLFVKYEHRKKGIGKQLLCYIKNIHSKLILDVYADNKRAVQFYLRENFEITNKHTHEDTYLDEFTMEWKK